MSTELDLQGYIAIIRKRLWMIVSIVLVASILAGIYSIYVKNPVYEASTKIIVNRTSGMSDVDPLNLNEINVNIRMIDTYKEIIRTPAIMDKVVQEFPHFDATAESLMNKVKVSSVNNTQVMTIVVRDESYRRAAEIVNAVSAVFQREIPAIFNVENVSILNEAPLDKSPSPVEPNVPLNIMIAFVVSLMLGVGAAFLLEYMDDTIKTEADVEQFLELPTLAVISKATEDEKREAAKSSANLAQAGEMDRVPSA